jgi:hypothetical protein
MVVAALALHAGLIFLNSRLKRLADGIHRWPAW